MRTSKALVAVGAILALAAPLASPATARKHKRKHRPPTTRVVHVKVLSPSTKLIQVPGQPDRVEALTGDLIGTIPRGSQARPDTTASFFAGKLVTPNEPNDSSCTGASTTTYGYTVPLGGTTMLFAASGHVTATLSLPGTVPLTGCRPADPTLPLIPAAATLEGDVQPGSLNRLHLSGTVTGIAVAGDRIATVTLDLFVRVSL